VWRMSCGGDGILEKMYTILRSVEMVSLLRVLAILHISFCLRLCWLAGKCGSLEKEYGFGVANMAEVVDLMDEACGKIVDDPDKLLDDVFMMNVFSPIATRLPPLQEYIEYMFEEKMSNAVGSREEEDKVCHGTCCVHLSFFLHAVTLYSLTISAVSLLPKQQLFSVWNLEIGQRPRQSTYHQSVERRV